MKVHLVYALPQQQYLETLDVADDATVEQALALSHIHEKFPDVTIAEHKLGIFAKLVKPSQVLKDGDRIEIYRSLPRKPRDAHAVDDKKSRIRAKKNRRAADAES